MAPKSSLGNGMVVRVARERLWHCGTRHSEKKKNAKWVAIQTNRTLPVNYPTLKQQRARVTPTIRHSTRARGPRPPPLPTQPPQVALLAATSVVLITALCLSISAAASDFWVVSADAALPNLHAGLWRACGWMPALAGDSCTPLDEAFSLLTPAGLARLQGIRALVVLCITFQVVALSTAFGAACTKNSSYDGFLTVTALSACVLSLICALLGTVMFADLRAGAAFQLPGAGKDINTSWAWGFDVFLVTLFLTLVAFGFLIAAVTSNGKPYAPLATAVPIVPVSPRNTAPFLDVP